MARFTGFSTHAPETILPLVLPVGAWDAVMVTYNYLSPPGVTDLIRRTRESGIAVIAMKNLINMSVPDPYETPEMFARRSSVQGRGPAVSRNPLGDIRAEKSADTTPQQALIRWVLNNPHVDVAIPGMTSFEHLEDDLAVMNLDVGLDENLLQGHLNRLRNRYCRGMLGCRDCEGQCPHGVEVHEINRCLGYVYGYGDIRLARENYQRLPSHARAEACSNCDSCKVKCVNGLDMNEQILRARALFC
jgi:predicted aldo/keto reductase-like oxidoreductase